MHMGFARSEACFWFGYIDTHVVETTGIPANRACLHCKHAMHKSNHNAPVAMMQAPACV